jgi:hypothetical protein
LTFSTLKIGPELIGIDKDGVYSVNIAAKELGLNQNEINEILDAQECLNQSQEFKREEILEDE